MPAGSLHCGRWLVRVALALTAGLAAAPALADSVTINVDQARIMHLPDRVATIVIGNPLIADATLQSGGILVLTGKGFGATNLVALDRSGKIVMDKTVRVIGPQSHELVVVYRGADRESYSCAPECQPRITLGDTPNFFNATIAQSGMRTGQAQGAK
ncbi:MAG TPA: pilus assembly protein N-terminal domain-containing protein [Pseudolabrys sp.]|nr:pilus assembly protein N-terminal domain-containing protein [Pseudolabrys sp.]